MNGFQHGYVKCYFTTMYEVEKNILQVMKIPKIPKVYKLNIISVNTLWSFVYPLKKRKRALELQTWPALFSSSSISITHKTICNKVKQ